MKQRTVYLKKAIKVQHEKAASTRHHSDFFFLIKRSFGKFRRVGLEINCFTYTARASVIQRGAVDIPSHDMNCSSPKDEAWHAAFLTWAIGTSLCVSLNSVSLGVSREGELQLPGGTASFFQTIDF